MQPKNVGALLATGAIVVVAWFGPYDKPEPKIPLQTTQVLLTNGIDSYTIQAEIADTPKERAQGLMHRTALPENGGMLFLWPDLPNGEMPAASGFWMKNTPLPLAIIFMENGKVIHIERNAKANTLDIIQPSNLSRSTTAVLEIAATHALAQHIQMGWQVKIVQ